MKRLAAAVSPFVPGLSKKEWEGVFIASFAVALWFFQRAAKWPRWSGGWMLRSLFIYVLIPFAIHAYLSLEGARRRFAAGALGTLILGAFVARFVLAPSDPSAWAIVAAGVLVSAPLFFFADARELGVRPGEVKLWLPFVAAGWAIAAIGILAMMHTASFLKSYPYVPIHRSDVLSFVWREALEVVDMFSWEFFFRGFLLFTLAPRVGLLAAILVQSTLFACAHVNKPEIEIYASIVGGLLLGQLCFRVRSMMPAFVAHQAIFLTAEIAGAWVKLSR